MRLRRFRPNMEEFGRKADRSTARSQSLRECIGSSSRKQESGPGWSQFLFHHHYLEVRRQFLLRGSSLSDRLRIELRRRDQERPSVFGRREPDSPRHHTLPMRRGNYCRNHWWSGCDQIHTPSRYSGYLHQDLPTLQ